MAFTCGGGRPFSSALRRAQGLGPDVTTKFSGISVYMFKSCSNMIYYIYIVYIYSIQCMDIEVSIKGGTPK